MNMLSCRVAVLSVAKRFRPETMIQMEDLLKSIHSFYHSHGVWNIPDNKSIERRIRESKFFERLNKNHPDNINHIARLYKRK